MPIERIDKILVSQGIGSRKEVKSRIKSGEVAVDGKILRDSAQKIDPENQNITVCGEELHFRRYLYLMMNKPKGVLSASRDTRQQTVLDLIPQKWYRKGLFPAGRLDIDTVGLIIITDDGEFAHKMLSPKKKVYKRYEAVVDGMVTEKEQEQFREGIEFLDGTVCLPAELLIRKSAKQSEVTIEICEGKFHQIKKMFLAVGMKVLFLKRVQIGKLRLDPHLKEGECRELTQEEICQIFLL